MKTPKSRFPDDRNSRIMILGSPHFITEGLDEVNVNFGDSLGDQRQQEIEAVLERLELFQPTMIALEFPSEAEEKLNEFYSQFATDQGDGAADPLMRYLQPTEHVQLGFRLAKKLSHLRVFAIDEMTIRPMEQLEQFAKFHGYQEFLDYRSEENKRLEAEQDSAMQQTTLIQLLIEYNTFERDLFAGEAYVNLVRLSDGSNRPGVEQLVEWYRRNVMIFQNLYRITKGRVGERILVIYGAGHGYLLRDLVRNASDFELVDSKEFLKSESNGDKPNKCINL